MGLITTLKAGYGIATNRIAYTTLKNDLCGVVGLAGRMNFSRNVVACVVPGIPKSNRIRLETEVGNRLPNITIYKGSITESDLSKVLPVLRGLSIDLPRSDMDYFAAIKASGLIIEDSAVPKDNSFVLGNLLYSFKSPVLLCRAVEMSYGNLKSLSAQLSIDEFEKKRGLTDENTNLLRITDDLRKRIDTLGRFGQIAVQMSESLLDPKVDPAKIEQLSMELCCSSLNYRRIVYFSYTEKVPVWATDGKARPVLEVGNRWGTNLEIIRIIETVLEGQMDLPINAEDQILFQKWSKSKIIAALSHNDPKVRSYARKLIAQSALLPFSRRGKSLSPTDETPLGAALTSKRGLSYNTDFSNTMISYGWTMDVSGQGSNARAELYKLVYNNGVENKYSIVNTMLELDDLRNFDGEERQAIMSGSVPDVVSIILQNKLHKKYKETPANSFDPVIFQAPRSIIVKSFLDKRGYQVSDVDNTTMEINPGMLLLWGGDIKAFVTEYDPQMKRVYVLERPFTGTELTTDETEMLRATIKLMELVQVRKSEETAKAEMYKALREVILSLVETIDAKDPYTRGHSERVAIASEAIARQMGYPLNTLEVYLHDIGKIGVPEHILQKPAALDADERAIMEIHPVVGARILEQVSFYRDKLDVILYHHERVDGLGYPEGLAGDNIPLVARIVAVADTFDAMTSDRPYRKGLTVETAFEELILSSGTQLDPNAVKAFLQTFVQSSIDLEKFMLRTDKSGDIMQIAQDYLRKFNQLAEISAFQTVNNYVVSKTSEGAYNFGASKKPKQYLKDLLGGTDTSQKIE